jgi:hypothetical protein
LRKTANALLIATRTAKLRSVFCRSSLLSRDDSLATKIGAAPNFEFLEKTFDSVAGARLERIGGESGEPFLNERLARKHSEAALDKVSAGRRKMLG